MKSSSIISDVFFSLSLNPILFLTFGWKSKNRESLIFLISFNSHKNHSFSPSLVSWIKYKIDGMKVLASI